MEGLLNLDMQIAGTLRQPLFSGGIYLREGLLQLPDAGVTLADIDLRATSAGSNALNLVGEFRSGKGTGAIGGAMMLSPAGRLLADVTVNGTDLQTIRLPQLSLESSPDLAIRIDEEGIDVSGNIVIPTAVARIRSLPGTVVQKSPDVIVHSAERVEAKVAKAETIVTGDVNVVLGDNVRFYGFGLESRLDGSLRLRQKRRGALRGTGTVRVRDGFLMGYGKELRVDRGTLNFTGPLDDPGVNVQVSRNAIYEGRQYTVGLRLTGTARNVITTPFSRPAMSERDVLAFLLLDRPASSSGEDTDLSGAVLALGLGKMLPGGDGGFGSVLGLDEVSFEGSELEQTSVVAGKRITDDLYIRYAFGLFGEPGSFRIRYFLGRGFSVESSTGVNQAIDVIYVVEKD
jgi:translocation and assembly module TamB